MTKRVKRASSCRRSRSNASSNSSSSAVITSGDENLRAGASREAADAPPGRRAHPNAWRISGVRARDQPSCARIIARDLRVLPVIIDPTRSDARDRAIGSARDRAREAVDALDQRLPTIAGSGHRDRAPVRGNPVRVPEIGGGTVDRAANHRA